MKCHNGTNISERTTKMGNILSFSTLPWRMCRKGVPCYNDGCYAKKICALRKNVAKSWGENTALLEAGKYDEVASDIVDAVAFKHAKLFRWFVGGDIHDASTMVMMIAVANSCPDTEFMAFTKCYDIPEQFHEDIPDNLRIVLSAWKTYAPSEEQKQLFPVCYFDDGTPECGVPDNAVVCGGDCEHCQLCFHMSPGECVVIKKH